LRALRKQIREYALLVDIGNTSADIAILQNGQLKQTSSLATAGEALTRSVAQGLSLSVPQAEKYKHTYGLETNQLEGKIAKVMYTPINNIVEHINKNIRFVKTLSNEARIDQIVLSGGTALLPNFSYYLVNQLNIEVDLANPLQECLNKNLPGQLISNAPRFCSVIGLALRD
jgi:type IV pilus assembly protein PilM